MQILCFASADFEEPNWVNAQHLMWRLARRHDVLYVNSLGLRMPRATPRDARKILRRLRAARRPLRRPDPTRRLHVYTPLTLPQAANPAWRRLGAELLAGGLRRALQRLGFERPLAWLFLPTAVDLLDRIEHDAVLYHCVDAYEANPGVDRRLIGRLEQRLLERAALVIATSEPLAQRLRRAHREVALLPNVADLTLFPPPGEPPPEPPPLAALRRPRIGYLGNLADYKCDLPLLVRAARARPDFSWVFIGDVGQGEAGTPTAPLGAAANVTFVPQQPREALGAFLHHIDVGLIPFRENETTRHSFPMKFFEYLACGVPVVAPRLESLRAHLREPIAYPYAGDEGFLAAIELALAARSGGAAAARRRLAQRHSWERRMPEIEALLARIANR
jgi:glycosyltransferase involved in cell wall biosynthesis